MQYTNNYSLKKPQLLEPALITDLNNNADAIDTLLYQNRRISSAEYDQNASYAVGDLVVYENLFYRCIGATSGNWDSTKWVRTTLASEVIDAKASGGSVVEGNPSGTATAQLEKLGIDNDIFFINDASKIIADPYDSTSTYAVGDYCIYNTLLYKCITAVSTAEAFDSTKWTACLVTDEMGSGGGGGSSTLAGLDDVSLTTPTQGQALIYDGEDWVNGKGGSDLIVNAQIYSTEEKQIGVWVDSKPLYQKTVLIDNISSAIGIQRFAHGISNIETVIAINGTWLNKSDSTIYIGTKDIVRPDSPTDNTGVWADATNIVMSTGVNRSNQKLYITIQYTKTTDTPGSGGYSAYGLAPVIYSTEEREVGVWTDGKPIYKKTVNIPNITILANSDYSTPTSAFFPNVDNIINYECTVGNQIIPSIHVSTSLNPYSLSILIERDGNIVFTRASGGSATISPAVTMMYTKTTDSPGSGTWTPSGVPAVHYSTDEQVVGTIQNTTLYEKLVTTGGSVPTGATLILRTALSNGYDVIQYTKSSS